MKNNSPVSAWIEEISIPTYPVYAPDPNPMFFEKRVNQGSSGRIYPNPFTDQLSSEKIERAYRAIYLENEWLKLSMLPELGGRIFTGLDKTNQYDFFYRHKVIKPALIGLFGPWISGGVEFNWPQHHRPSTFMPVDYSIESHPDGAQTVWMSEHEPMNRTKGMVGICLYPGKSIVETKVRLYNRTPHVQTFLWWENAAVHIHPDYQVFFPPDVHSVVFHARSYTNHFPMVKGVYAGEDFGAGADVSYYKNIHSPTSFFASESKYAFFGGYDHRKGAGVIHVADRFVSPGKKFFTWADGPFGHSWQRNLADEDAPYLELMAGVYTDNQPDFSWLMPYETKTFSQYWYPISAIGPAKNANRQAAVNLTVVDRQAQLGMCVTEEFPKASLLLIAKGQVLARTVEDLSPARPFQASIELPSDYLESDLTFRIYDRQDQEIIRLEPEPPSHPTPPPPADIPSLPEKTPTTEDLYLVGLHLEQYRHATVSPEPYWREALQRDSGDIRSNLMLGRMLLRQGEFVTAEQHLRRALQRQTSWNFNPYDGEPSYQLGLALRYQGCLDEAYQSFYKSTWNYAWGSAGYYALAEIDCLRGDYTQALEHLESSIQTNLPHLKGRDLIAVILRHLGLEDDAESLLRETLSLDPLDLWATNELRLVKAAQKKDKKEKKLTRQLKALVEDDIQTILDIAFDYLSAGFLEDAHEWLDKMVIQPKQAIYPMVYYILGYIARQLGRQEKASNFYKKAARVSPDYCFPFRLEEMIILRDALQSNPNDARAAYYLGNLLYDKDRHEEAVHLWQRAVEIEPDFSITWRNLGLAAYNHGHDLEKSLACYRKAFQVNQADPRLLYELDQIMKRAGVPPEERLRQMEANQFIVHLRDDLVLEMACLYNRTLQPQKALDLLNNRSFHPWEGGEGQVAGQFVMSYWISGRQALEAGQSAQAIADFNQATRPPDSLGEARYIETNTGLLYYLGLAYQAAGDQPSARESFTAAVQSQASLPLELYYQGLANLQLEEPEPAQKIWRRLGDEARKMASQPDPSAFFHAHLPSLLFIDDLNALKKTESTFLTGLVALGKGEQNKARQAFKQVLKSDPSHQLAWEEYRRLV